MNRPLLALLTAVMASGVTAQPVVSPQSAASPPISFAGVPFHLEADIVPGSALDVSFLLHRPAGRHGWVRSKGERLLFRDGTPAYFWGGNFCLQALYPPEAEAPAIARRLAMSGFNLARLGYWDGGAGGLFRRDRPDTHTLNEERLQRFDALLAAFKAEGVYSLLVFGQGRKELQAGDDVPDYAVGSSQPARVGYVIGRLFEPRIERADQEVWRALLSHKNPHTGLRLADDPAIAALEVLNEASPFYLYHLFEQHTPAPLRTQVQERWNQWLAARYHGKRAELARRWGPHALQPDEDPARGTVALDFSLLDPLANPDLVSNERASDWNRFLAEVSRAYYERQIRFLRRLGVQQPICCNGGGSYSAADKWSTRAGDLFDQHKYHDHPKTSGGMTYVNASALESGLNIVQFLARDRLAGLPYGVTEFDFCFPNDWRAEGWVPMAAYARFQSWNLLTAFAYWAGSWEERASLYAPETGIKGVWRILNDPATFGQWPVAALIFLRGDVQPARQTINIGFSDADVFFREPARFPPDALRWLDGLALVHRTRSAYFTKRYSGDGDRLVPSGRSTPNHDRPQAAGLLPRPQDGWLVADTGELRYRQDPGIVVVDTPRTQGVVGFTGGSASHTTRDVSLKVGTDFATIILSTLDGHPICSANRLLLVAVGRCQNTGFAPQAGPDGHWLAGGRNQGRGPILIEPVRFTLTLHHEAKSRAHRVFALDGSGKRTTSLPVTETGDTLALRVEGSPATIYYEIAE